jgi:MSHA pilin protein MshC
MITFSPLHKLPGKSGFTLVELVVIIIVLGILSAFALPKFFNLDDYRERAAYDEVAAALRYAQKLAVGSGCAVQVVFSAGNNYALRQGTNGCADDVNFTTIAGHPVNAGAVSGVNLNSTQANFSFDPMGRSSTAVRITVGGRTINVIAETGTVDAQ